MKMCFTKFQKEKTPVQTMKKRTLKSRKINIFRKELTHGFGPKMAIFPSFIFQARQDRKMSFTIFQNEKTPFQSLKTRSLKSRKSCIFPKGLIHFFFTKLAIFPTFFVFGNISQENVFYDILQQKNAFLGYKNNKFKKSKN